MIQQHRIRKMQITKKMSIAKDSALFLLLKRSSLLFLFSGVYFAAEISNSIKTAAIGLHADTAKPEIII
jgi:hypothetical protein